MTDNQEREQNIDAALSAASVLHGNRAPLDSGDAPSSRPRPRGVRNDGPTEEEIAWAREVGELSPSDTAIFESLSAPHGGHEPIDSVFPQLRCYTLAPLLNRGRRIWKYLAGHPNTRGPMPHVAFALVRSLELNAFAASRNGRHFVGTNVGAAMLVQDYFQRVLSLPTSLLRIGEPSKEVENPPLSRTSPSDFPPPHLASTHEGVLRVHPQCPIRFNASAEMLVQCFDFLFVHELAHLRNGHVEYFNQHLAAGPIMEAAARQTDVDRATTLQTLEMDADAVASTVTMMEVLKRSRSEAAERGVTAAEAFRPLVRDWLFAIESLFFLMGSLDARGIGDDERWSHPHPRVRTPMALSSAQEALKSETEPQLAGILGEEIGSVLSDALQSFMRLYQIKDRPALVANHADWQAGRTKVLLERWKDLRDELGRLSWVHKLPD